MYNIMRNIIEYLTIFAEGEVNIGEEETKSRFFSTIFTEPEVNNCFYYLLKIIQEF